MKHRYQSFTQIGRQFQSLERQVYADWTSVSFPLCQRSCLIWRIMTNTLTNTMTNTYVVIFCRFQFLVEVIIPDIRISSSLIERSKKGGGMSTLPGIPGAHEHQGPVV